MTIVKIQRPLYDQTAPWLVYDRAKNHIMLIQGETTKALAEIMQAKPEAYFEAKWMGGYWQIGEMVGEQGW